MREPTVLASAPFPLVLRNFVPTGLSGELERREGVRVHFISPYREPEFTDADGRSFPNHPVSAASGPNGVPSLPGVTAALVGMRDAGHVTENAAAAQRP